MGALLTILLGRKVHILSLQYYIRILITSTVAMSVLEVFAYVFECILVDYRDEVVLILLSHFGYLWIFIHDSIQ